MDGFGGYGVLQVLAASHSDCLIFDVLGMLFIPSLPSQAVDKEGEPRPTTWALP